MNEEGIEFETSGLFYNPNMRFSRSFTSLAVGAIKKRIELLDGFGASGIRGLRYAKENKNVKKVVLLDIWKIAPGIIEKNAHKNKILNFETYAADFNEFVIKNKFDFIEIDPFGSPVSYLNNAFYSFRKTKEGYISLCATDTAVLCGTNTKACLKKYGSKNLRNEFTHEIGARILLKKIAEIGAQFDFFTQVLYSLSHRHYIRILVRIIRSAEKASAIPQSIGYLAYCFHCGYRETGKFPNRTCSICKKEMDYAGPLWLGELHNKKFLEKMKKINLKREYADKKEIEKVLDLLIGEIKMPCFYYGIHEVCKRKHFSSVPKISELITELRKKGFATVKTHFNEKSIKTKAGIRDIERSIENLTLQSDFRVHEKNH